MSTGVVDQQEYLKKYLNKEKNTKTKEKKKKKSSSSSSKFKGFSVIDESLDLKDIPFGFVEEDCAPTIAEVTYESEKAKLADEFNSNKKKWKGLNSDEVTEDQQIEIETNEKGFISIENKGKDNNDHISFPKSDSKIDSLKSNPRTKESKNETNELPKDHLRTSPFPHKSSPIQRKNANLNTHSQTKREEYVTPPSRRGNDSDTCSPRQRRQDSDTSTSRRKRHDSDASPSRRKRHDSDTSPPRRKRHDSDTSPPRRKRHDLDSSPLRRKRHDSDTSPFRRTRQDSDTSPPRRKRHDSDTSPPRRKRHDSDTSPPRRKRLDSDGSPPRRKRHDSDTSPPRRKRHDSDTSPPRRKRRDSDGSPPRRKRRDSDTSPPRRKRHDSDTSPPRKRKDDLDISPVRGKRNESETLPRDKRYPFEKSHPGRKHDSLPLLPNKKHSAVFDSSRERKQDLESTSRDADASQIQNERFKKRSHTNESGNDSLSSFSKRKGNEHLKATSFKKIKGKVRKELSEEEKALAQKLEEKYQKWNKGVVQDQKRQEAINYTIHEMGKSFARAADDEDMNKTLKDVMRQEDPMLEYIAKKKTKENTQPLKPRYKGSFPPNRFNIAPGYRWDGVDRSSGYEKEWFTKQSSKRATEDESYKWSTEDM